MMQRFDDNQVEPRIRQAGVEHRGAMHRAVGKPLGINAALRIRDVDTLDPRAPFQELTRVGIGLFLAWLKLFQDDNDQSHWRFRPGFGGQPPAPPPATLIEQPLQTSQPLLEDTTAAGVGIHQRGRWGP